MKLKGFTGNNFIHYCKYCILVFIFLLGGNCANRTITKKKSSVLPSPNIAVSAVSGIDSLISFYFDWQFERRKIGLLPEMDARFSGRFRLPDRFYIKGTWKAGTEIEKINGYSIIGKEYRFDAKEKLWKQTTGSSLPNPLEKLKLVLSFGKFRFFKFDGIDGIECYVFKFKPNVYFLDPTETTHPTGLLWIDKKRKLPVMVKVITETKEINWSMKLSHFNSIANINVPFKPYKVKIFDIASKKNDISTIIKRLTFLGYNKPAINKSADNDIIFSIRSGSVSDSMLKAVFEKGEIFLYLGVWPKDPIVRLKSSPELLHNKYGKNSQLFFERGDVTKPIISTKKLLSKQDFSSFTLKNDFLGKYSIYGTVSPESRDTLTKIVTNYSDQPFVVIIDNVAVLVSVIQNSWLVENQLPITKGMGETQSSFIYAKVNGDTLKKTYHFLKIGYDN